MISLYVVCCRYILVSLIESIVILYSISGRLIRLCQRPRSELPSFAIELNYIGVQSSPHQVQSVYNHLARRAAPLEILGRPPSSFKRVADLKSSRKLAPSSSKHTCEICNVRADLSRELNGRQVRHRYWATMVHEGYKYRREE
jgi:hypothetical protein